MNFHLPQPPESFTRKVGAGFEQVECLIAADELMEREYFVTVQLNPEDDTHEMIIALQEVHPTIDHAVFILSGLDVEGFSRYQRRCILDCMCDAITELLRTCRPPAFVRITVETHLPSKALAKHDRMTATIEAAGYGVTETVINGHHIWTAERGDV